MNIEQLKGYEQELDECNITRSNLANEYCLERARYGKAKFQVNLAIAKRIKELLLIKKNIGIEMAETMVLSEAVERNDIELISSIQVLTESEQSYKGLEKLIDALEGRSISIMGIMKRQTENEVFGTGE